MSKRKFRWDPHHNQPHTDMSKWEKIWESRHDLGAFVRIAGSNLAAAPAIWSEYRRLARDPSPWCPVDARRLGVAISPAAETWLSYEQTLSDLSARTIVMRVPGWDPQAAFAMLPRLLELKERGYRVILPLLQDRGMVLEPEKWTEFVRHAAHTFAPLEPDFEVGHAFNRKKWGVWHPGEYLRLLEAMAPVRTEVAARWIGPAVIDFEPYYLVPVLREKLPFLFDAVSVLLYVDRRGSPDYPMYGRFDLDGKIRLLRAIVNTSAHGDAPLSLSEFNWPIKATGKYSPAGGNVQVTEEIQAACLAQYVLTACGHPGVREMVWWELAARGYGLIDPEDGGWRKRMAFEVLRRCAKAMIGGEVRRLSELRGTVRGTMIRREGAYSVALYAWAEPEEVSLPAGVEGVTLAGEALTLSGGKLILGPMPALLTGSRENLAGLLARLGGRELESVLSQS